MPRPPTVHPKVEIASFSMNFSAARPYDLYFHILGISSQGSPSMGFPDAKLQLMGPRHEIYWYSNDSPLLSKTAKNHSSSWDYGADLSPLDRVRPRP